MSKYDPDEHVAIIMVGGVYFEEDDVTEFTYKDEAITDVMQMVTGKPRTDGQCVFDGDGDGVHSLEFRTPLDVREYEISGMCQTCQDGVFN